MKRDMFSGDAVFLPERTAFGWDHFDLQQKRFKWHVSRSRMIACLMAAVFAASSASAAPRTIEDCEKIQAADAYNQCLASFGPAAHEHAHSADPEGASGSRSGEEYMIKSPTSAEAAHSPSRWRGRWRRYEHAERPHDPWANIRHAGRHHITFSVK